MMTTEECHVCLIKLAGEIGGDRMPQGEALEGEAQCDQKLFLEVLVTSYGDGFLNYHHGYPRVGVNTCFANDKEN